MEEVLLVLGEEVLVPTEVVQLVVMGQMVLVEAEVALLEQDTIMTLYLKKWLVLVVMAS
jgi:hypothetical protein